MSTQGVKDIKLCAECGHPKHVHNTERGCLAGLYLKGMRYCFCQKFSRRGPLERNNAPCDICYKQDRALMVESNLYEALGNFDTLARDFIPVVGSEYMDLTDALDRIYTSMDAVMDQILTDLQHQHVGKGR